MRIVGVSGGSGTGKDWFYDNALRQLDYRRVALADHFKVSLVGKGFWTYDDVFVTKNPECRSDLQDEGTKRGREVFGEDIWCRTLATWMEHWRRTWGFESFAVTDIRFPNEVEYIQSIGGKVYRIIAPERYASNGMSDAARQHISERALDGYTGFDGYLYNDFDDPDPIGQLHARLRSDRLLTASASAKSNVLLGV